MADGILTVDSCVDCVTTLMEPWAIEQNCMITQLVVGDERRVDAIPGEQVLKYQPKLSKHLW